MRLKMKSNLIRMLKTTLLILILTEYCYAKEKIFNEIKDQYSPILYGIEYAREESVCEVLLDIVNEDLKLSPYINYLNKKNFYRWETIFKAFSAKNPQKDTSGEPTWLSVIDVDIDNDGHEEKILKAPDFRPLEVQHIHVFEDRPFSKIFNLQGDYTQKKRYTGYYSFVDDYYDFLKTEKKLFTNFKELVLTGAHDLKELPYYNELTKQPAVYMDGMDFFVTNILEKNYLVVDSMRHYDPSSKNEFISDPWYVLFEVSHNAMLNNMCILKREK